jgi:hypothetical protein
MQKSFRRQDNDLFGAKERKLTPDMTFRTERNDINKDFTYNYTKTEENLERKIESKIRVIFN